MLKKRYKCYGTTSTTFGTGTQNLIRADRKGNKNNRNFQKAFRNTVLSLKDLCQRFFELELQHCTLLENPLRNTCTLSLVL